MGRCPPQLSTLLQLHLFLQSDQSYVPSSSSKIRHEDPETRREVDRRTICWFTTCANAGAHPLTDGYEPTALDDQMSLLQDLGDDLVKVPLVLAEQISLNLMWAVINHYDERNMTPSQAYAYLNALIARLSSQFGQNQRSLTNIFQDLLNLGLDSIPYSVSLASVKKKESKKDTAPPTARRLRSDSTASDKPRGGIRKSQHKSKGKAPPKGKKPWKGKQASRRRFQPSP